MEEALKQYTTFTVGNLGFTNVTTCPLAFIKGFTWIAQPLNEHLTGEGASRKSEQLSFSEDALEAFQALK